MAHDFVLRAGRLMERQGQIVLQSFPRHLDQMVGRRTGRRFEIGAGVPVNVDDLAPIVDDDRRRRVARDQQLLDQIGNRGGARAGRGASTSARAPVVLSSIRQETVPGEEMCRSLPSV